MTRSSGSAHGLGWRLRAWSAPGLLAVVALHQMLASCDSGLVAWKGGGFGMFAAIDGAGLREVRAYDHQGVRVEIPATLFEHERRALEWPREARLAALRRGLADDGIDPERLEVWRVVFDRELEPAWRRVAVADFAAPPP